MSGHRCGVFGPSVGRVSGARGVIAETDLADACSRGPCRGDRINEKAFFTDSGVDRAGGGGGVDGRYVEFVAAVGRAVAAG